MNIYGKDWKDDNDYDEYKTMNYDLLEVVGVFFICFGLVYIIMKIFN